MPARAVLAVVAVCLTLSEPAWAGAADAQPKVEHPAETTARPPAALRDGPTVTPGGVPAEVIDASAVQGIIGRAVKSSLGEDMGHIVDFLVSPAGDVRAAVLDFGGVLGVGSRRVAVGWKALSFAELAKDGPVVLRLTRNQIRMAPELKSGDPIVVLEPAPVPAKTPQHPAEPNGRSGGEGAAKPSAGQTVEGTPSEIKPSEIKPTEAKPSDSKPTMDKPGQSVLAAPPRGGGPDTNKR